MLTADEDEAAEVRGLDSGADDFFKKSADTEILVVRTRVMLERSTRSQSVLRQSDSAFKSARILAVDDSETYLSYLSSLLQNEGYSIDLVSDPNEALNRLEVSAFDLVLVDLIMPVMDGIELCKRIVAMRDQMDNPIAVLMLTGREAKEDLTRALEAGADDFVGKSSDEAVLRGRIRALLRRKFFQEENQRILEELKDKELEAASALAEKEAALARAAEERQRHAEAVARQMQQAKEELEQSNEELIRSNDELRQFAFVASHDLQEPLRSVISFCNLLKEECQGKLDADADDFIERIVGGAMRMKALVTDLLTYSRVNYHEQHPLKMVELSEIVDEAMTNLQSSIADSGAEISCHNLPTLMGDKGQLVQLMQNLIGNAIMYRGEHAPRIDIEARRVRDHWEIAVSDNGIGIDAAYHDQIFEIFKRLHGREKYPGTGIGLAVCRKIVQKHAGKLWVESQPGEGSTFRFTIPSARADENHERNRQLTASVECDVG
jgi:signal transduction histidine kinase